MTKFLLFLLVFSQTACSPNGISFKQTRAGTPVAPNSLTFASHSARISTPGTPIAVMPMGDSNTFGATVPGGYRKELDQLLQAAGIGIQYVGDVIDNRDPSYSNNQSEGHSGWAIDDLLNGRADSDFKPMDSVRRRQPDIILLMAGTNDIYGRRRSTLDTELYMLQLLDAIRTVSPSSNIIASTIFPFVDVNTRPRQYMEPYNSQAVEFNDWLAGEVQARQNRGEPISLVDQYGHYNLDTALFDGIHPGAQGLSIAAQTWFPETNRIAIFRLQVNQAFLDLLGRPADDGGLVFWVNLMMRGMPYQQMHDFIAGSPEAQVRQNGVHGFVDGVVASGGQYFIVGWACSSGQATSIPVHFYAGGPAGSGTFVSATPASVASELAVGQACSDPTNSAHRFTIPLSPATSALFAGQPIYVHGISPFGGANNLLAQSGQFTVPSY